jgi:serine/threonine protein kinase
MEKTSGSIIKPPGYPDKSNIPAKDTHRQRKKKPSRDFSITTEPDFPECNLISNPGDSKLEYFNLKIIYHSKHTGFEELRDFPIKLHDIVAGRYEITGYIGSAAFSRAVHCLDHKTGNRACMKIIKNNKDFFDQCLDEIKLLKYIKVSGDTHKYHLLDMYDYFYYKEHLFIVCELLGDNLYEFYKKNMQNTEEPVYFTLPRLQKVTQQCLIALQFIHSLGLIHCDLKPENILMKNVENCDIKVIDFGSSCYTTDVLSTYVQSRSYRAPEVILGLPYGQKIDMWSLGCILAELLTGRVIFQNYSVVTLLARIIGIIGPIPLYMMQKGAFVDKYFSDEGELYENTEIITPKKTSLQGRVRTEDQLFLDFLRQILTIDPDKRLSANEALQHPWLKKVY